MVVLYVVSRSFEEQHVIWPWVRSFAEAGMIGALADWFAVVALFRHPFGLPIPHTAIIQKQKNKIGASLGRFIKTHFLTKDLISQQLHQYALVERSITWLATDQNADKVATILNDQLPTLTQDSSYERGCDKVSELVCQKLSSMPLEQDVGRWMVASMHGPSFRKMVAPIFAKLADGVADNKEWVGQEASQRAPVVGSKLLSRLTKGVTEAVSAHMVVQVSDQLRSASNDTSHAFYGKLEEALQELGVELQDETGAHGEWAIWREKILNSPTVLKSCSSILLHMSELLREDHEEIHKGISKLITKGASRIQSDQALIERWEEQLIDRVTHVSTHYADAFEQMILKRVEDWDADSLTTQIERNIGTDLQFIRINGSLIGGLIGVILYGVGLLVWGA